MASGRDADSSSGSGGGGNDNDEDDGWFLPPRMQGDNLTIHLPLCIPITCLVGRCRTQFRNKT